MADTRYQPQTRTGTEVQIDQGLRSYMLKVYNYMGAGLAITGACTPMARSRRQLTPRSLDALRRDGFRKPAEMGSYSCATCDGFPAVIPHSTK